MIYLKKNYIPLFSIVVTTYNRLTLLKRAIGSIIAQSETDWECIVVDDGSNDNTFEYLIDLCKTDSRFRYVYNKNLGTASAKNIGIKNASGYYLTFLDSDDEYKINHLESRKEILNANPDIDFLHGGFQIIGDIYVPDLHSDNMISLYDCIIGGTFFINRKKLLKVGGFDLVDYGDDNYFYHKLKKYKFAMGKVEENTYIYHREHQDTITKNHE
ncbi:glycosyltransferase family 2 protein [Candidatus Kapabacteria bacterium]|nr:glycosyltransferase family 2 protein [Candidatus Kapabacteria bacterium]